MDIFDISLQNLLRRDPDLEQNLVEFLTETGCVFGFSKAVDEHGIAITDSNNRVYVPRSPIALAQTLFSHPDFAVRLIGIRNEPISLNPQVAILLGNIIAGHANEFPAIDRVHHGWAMTNWLGKLVQTVENPNTQSISTPPLIDRADKTFPHLRALFSGVHCTPQARARLLVHTILIAARPALDDFPILVLDGPKKGVGKTRTARAIAELYDCGSNIATYSANEDKLEFSLGDFAGRPGPTIIIFDNVRGKRGRGSAHQIRGQILSACANSPAVLVAAKRKALAPLQHPCLIFTMNRAELEHDLHDKCIAVRLHGAGEFAYMDPCPLVYVQDHASALLEEVCALLNGLEIGLPPQPVTRFGHYEHLANQVATKLGLDLDLRSSAATLDSLTVELSNLLDDYRAEHQDWPTIIEATKMLRTRRNMVELNEVLDRAKRATARAEAEALAEFISTNLKTRGFCIDNTGPMRRIRYAK